ncbi:prion-inhibition and propagation-domain-containing protein [Biscogniauxia mediterranea]|nr:prion-inhibition and propagation-domain-containing protein [Biscogniauxia mediterranea]
MADPLSTLGFGVGVVSLILQITDECIKGYKYFTEAAEMSESYRYLRILVQIEQQRFLCFAMEAGLLYEGGKICATLRVNNALLKDVLLEINSLFRNYEKKNGKYVNIMGPGHIQWNDKGEPQTNLMELLCFPPANDTARSVPTGKQRFSLSKSLREVGSRTAVAARKLRSVFAEPKRLIWVKTDKEGFETLVNKLKDLNSFLISLLDTSRARKLENLVEMKYLELLQLRNDYESLRPFVRALDQDTRNYHDIRPPISLRGETSCFEAAIMEGRSDEAKRRHLQSLARLKIRHIELNQTEELENYSVPRKSTSLLLDLSMFTYSKESLGGYDTSRRSMAYWDNRSVWIEWIEKPLRQGIDRMSECQHDKRIVLLARLLSEEMPPDFRAPRCLGYVKSTTSSEESEFGLVYERSSGNKTETTLTTLRQLLGSRPKPSITARISLCSALADCLFNFHAVDWLHKGLKSDNILFFGSATDEGSLSMPYITGYDLSRPSEELEMTEKPPFDPLNDIYRHPHVQFGEAKNYYLKSHDMYSLGIVLIEIALWKPIEAILGIGDLMTIRPAELRGIREKLLGDLNHHSGSSYNVPTSGGSEYLSQVARKFGDSYRDIVVLCLNATKLETPEHKGENHASIKFRLGVSYKEQVIDKLRLMRDMLKGMY